jgi:hypothetical protein
MMKGAPQRHCPVSNLKRPGLSYVLTPECNMNATLWLFIIIKRHIGA